MVLQLKPVGLYLLQPLLLAELTVPPCLPALLFLAGVASLLVLEASLAWLELRKQILCIWQSCSTIL